MDVLNRGFSGYNTDWALPILKQLLPTVKAQKEQASSIQLVTIFFGANDGSLPFCPQHVPVDRYKSNTKAMIDMVRNTDSIYYNPKMRIILITPPPVNEVQWEKHCESQGNKLNRTNASVRKYVDCIKDIGRETNIPVADIWSEIMDDVDQNNRDLSEFLLDGVHLNANGYQVIIEIIFFFFFFFFHNTSC
jgi:lysophospholipase L1-like esterase